MHTTTLDRTTPTASRSVPDTRPRRTTTDVRAVLLRADSGPDARIEVGGEPGVDGTWGSDPYPETERHDRVTRAALREMAREMAREEGLRVSITTRSDLVLRDLDLLRRVAKRNALHVSLAVATIDARLAGLLEPHASTPKARLSTLRRLRAGGVSAGLLVCPLLPGVNDVDAELNALLRAAREAGAQWVGATAVLLREPHRTRLRRTLAAGYPRVAARYEVWRRFQTGGHAGGVAGRRAENRARRDARVLDDAARRLHVLARRLGLRAEPHGELPRPARVEQRTFAFGET